MSEELRCVWFNLPNGLQVNYYCHTEAEQIQIFKDLHKKLAERWTADEYEMVGDDVGVETDSVVFIKMKPPENGEDKTLELYRALTNEELGGKDDGRTQRPN